MTRLPTPLGPMVVGVTDDGVCLLEFADRRMLETQLQRLRRHLGCVFVPGTHRLIDDLGRELDEYFRGERLAFDLPLLLPGTDFQRRVWHRLLDIPAGKTRSYTDIAIAVERPEAVRAVGRANGDNRIAILVPCHRVVGADGRLTGYGGGLWRKQRLLEIEGADSSASTTN